MLDDVAETLINTGGFFSNFKSMGLFGYNVYLECVVILDGKSAIYFMSGFPFNLDVQIQDCKDTFAVCIL